MPPRIGDSFLEDAGMKKLLAVVAVIGLLAGFVGCGKEESKTEGPAKDAVKKIGELEKEISEEVPAEKAPAEAD